jgi:hypothetical protein
MVASNCMHNYINTFEKHLTMHHIIQFLDRREYTKPNINALLEKWMSSNMFWAPQILKHMM